MGVNKYYKIQLLVSASTPPLYNLFIKWGRIGDAATAATSGDQCDQYMDEKLAVKDFETKFKDKTGNKWANRDAFVKKGAYNLIILHGQERHTDTEPSPPPRDKSKNRGDREKE